MAVTIPITTLSRDGTTPPSQTADTQTTLTLNRMDGRSYMEVVNTAGVSRTVTIDTPGNVDGLAIADISVVIPAGATRLIGPFSGASVGFGTVNITSTGAADVLFRGYALPPL